MQSVQPLFLNGTAYTVNELNLGQAIEIAQIPTDRHERKISAILTAILGGQIDPYELTLQERHYALMKYIERHQATFGYDIDFGIFEKEGMAQESVEVDGYTFRHLNGYECEALEQYASNYLDWVLGSIALQISGEHIAPMIPATSIDFAKNIIRSRVQELYALDLATSEQIFNSYYVAMDELNHLIRYGFDDKGVVVTSLDGQNDIRFCQIPTIPTTVRSVIESAFEQGSNDE